MSLNVKLLQKVKAQILAEPAQFVMDHWFTSDLDFRGLLDLPRPKIPNCGTAACIAGWAVAIGNHKKPSVVRDDYYAPDEAARLLRLPIVAGEESIDFGQRDGDACGGQLFLVNHWPARYKKAWHKAKTLKARARVAARRIDAYIKEHGGR